MSKLEEQKKAMREAFVSQTFEQLAEMGARRMQEALEAGANPVDISTHLMHLAIDWFMERPRPTMTEKLAAEIAKKKRRKGYVSNNTD